MGGDNQHLMVVVCAEKKWSSPMPIEHAAVLGALKTRP